MPWNKRELTVVDSGEVLGMLGEQSIHEWLQTEDGLRWEYVGLDDSEAGPDELVLGGLRYRSLYGNARYFWVGIQNGMVDMLHRNVRHHAEAEMDYREFRRKMEEFSGRESGNGYLIVLLPREEAFSLPTALGACN